MTPITLNCATAIALPVIRDEPDRSSFCNLEQQEIIVTTPVQEKSEGLLNFRWAKDMRNVSKFGQPYARDFKPVSDILSVRFTRYNSVSEHGRSLKVLSDAEELTGEHFSDTITN